MNNKIQYTITINQLAISRSGFEIDIIDAAIIDFVRHFIASEEMDIKDFEGERYYRLHSSHVAQQLPILGITAGRLTRRISDLIEKGYFKRYVEDHNTPWIRPTDKAKAIYGGAALETWGSVANAGGGPSQTPDNNSTSNKNTETQGTIVPTAQAPGDPGINSLLLEVQEICKAQRWAYDRKDDRRMARHILTAKDFGSQAESCGLSPHEYALGVIKASAVLDFWRGKVSGPAAIYRHHAKIYNEAKEMKNRNVTPHFKTL